MWRTIKTALNRLRYRRYLGRIERELALIGRGQVRCDGLRLNKICNRLEIQWRARDIHPWDRSLPLESRATALIEQALADTEAAISRLFEALPQVDVIDLTVLDPASDTTMMAGTVHRSVLTGSRRFLSVRMRLRELGIDYRLAGSHCSEE